MGSVMHSHINKTPRLLYTEVSSKGSLLSRPIFVILGVDITAIW